MTEIQKEAESLANKINDGGFVTFDGIIAIKDALLAAEQRGREQAASAPSVPDSYYVEAIKKFLCGSYPVPSKNEQCKHGRYGFEVCESCIEEYFEGVLSSASEIKNTVCERELAIFLGLIERLTVKEMEEQGDIWKAANISTQIHLLFEHIIFCARNKSALKEAQGRG